MRHGLEMAVQGTGLPSAANSALHAKEPRQSCRAAQSEQPDLHDLAGLFSACAMPATSAMAARWVPQEVKSSTLATIYMLFNMGRATQQCVGAALHEAVPGLCAGLFAPRCLRSVCLHHLPAARLPVCWKD